MRTIIGTALAGLVLSGTSGCNQKAAEPVPAPTPSAAPAASTPAPAATRLRGVADTVGADSLGIRGYDGKAQTVALGDKTAFAWVVKSDLSTLKDGDFIGTATTGPDSDLKAVEIVIFPESMRGTGEGHYDWDMPAAVANADRGGAGAAADGMTNGTVTQSGMTNGTVTQSGMTNGTVQQSGMTNGTVTGGAGRTGATQLTVSYKGGTAKVTVPPGIPVVRFEPTQKAMLAKGQKLFVVAAPNPDGTPAAQFVAMGKDGLMPPM